MPYYSAGKLEERLFTRHDKSLIKEYTKANIHKGYKEVLAKISGINNGKLLDKFLKLEIRPETMASISLVPLIEVGWADGALDELERNAILDAVEKLGWGKGSVDYLLLARWLANKPEQMLFEMWKEYIQRLCDGLSNKEIELLKSVILGHALTVANASGGVMGIGKICAEEKVMLKTIEKSFKKQNNS